jgi:hypothetical protein
MARNRHTKAPTSLRIGCLFDCLELLRFAVLPVRLLFELVDLCLEREPPDFPFVVAILLTYQENMERIRVTRPIPQQ